MGGANKTNALMGFLGKSLNMYNEYLVSLVVKFRFTAIFNLHRRSMAMLLMEKTLPILIPYNCSKFMTKLWVFSKSHSSYIDKLICF
jgi:hypothetical protein